MTKRDFEGDAATVFREVVLEAGAALGLGPAICEDLARNSEERLRMRSGGEVSYIAKLNRKQRDADIRKHYHAGSNEVTLGRDYNLSPRRILQIVGR